MPKPEVETTTEVKTSTTVVTKVLIGVGMVVTLFIAASIAAATLGGT
ncbi:MAG: hypothetical protein ACOYUK_04470 [Patescibacteria group bacterium]